MRRLLAPAVVAALLPLYAPVASAAAAVLCDVSGTLATAGGTAVPGVKIDSWNANGSVSSSTSSDGSFAFATICGAGTFQLSWQTAPVAGLPKSAFLTGAVEVSSGDRYAMKLPPAVTATVNVTDAQQTPVVGGGVFQTNEHSDFDADPAQLFTGGPAFNVVVEMNGAQTDAKGTAKLVTFPDHDMNLTVYPPSGSPLQPSDFVLDATRSVTRDVTLSTTPAGVPYPGTVRDAAGNGVPGLVTSIDGSRTHAKTDAGGAFTAYGPTATGQLWGGVGDREEALAPLPSHLPRWFALGPVPVTAIDGQPIEVTLPEIRRIRIIVRNHKGDTQGGVSLLRRTDGVDYLSEPTVLVPGTPAQSVRFQAPSSLHSDWDGVIAFNAFSSASLSKLRLSWYAPSGDEINVAVPTIDARTDRDVTVQLPAPPTKHVVTGTLTDADGDPVTGAQIFTMTDRTYPDSAGRFSLPVNDGVSSVWITRRDTNPGWKVDSSLPDWVELRVPLRVEGPTRMALRLPRAHRISMRAIDPVDGDPVASAFVVHPDSDNIEYASVTVAGAAGPADGLQPVQSIASGASGVTVLKAFTIQRAPVLNLVGKRGRVLLRSRILGLEISRDKSLDLVLGTPDSPSTYTPPTAVAGVTAMSTPTQVTATVVKAAAATSTVTATVRWRAPQRTGGQKITGYRVIASPGGRAVTVGAKARTATINGLARGTAYSFAVRAVNKIGPARGTSAPLDIAAPRASMTAPGKVVRARTATIAWTGSDDASGIAGYDVRMRSRRGDAAWSRFTRLATGTKATSRTVEIHRGYTYCVSVRAHDRVGRAGPWPEGRCFSRPAG